MIKGLKLISLLRNSFSEDRIAVFYRGNFDDLFTDKLISLADYEVDKKAKKRMAFLISESFQNIIRHGNDELTEKASSVFGVRAIDPFLHIFSSNSVSAPDKLFLEEKLGKINQLDKDELKIYYTQVLEEGTFNKKGGAGLGLIEMAKKSQKPIQTVFRESAEDVFVFNMQIDLLVDEQASTDLISRPMQIEENTAMNDLMIENGMIFLYKGDFSDETISPMLSILEGNTTGASDSIGYKIYHAAVELMQNVVRHSNRAGTREGMFAINKIEKGYYLCTGNYTTAETEKLKEYADRLNLMNKEELNVLYRDRLKAGAALSNNNAGVGLIDLRRSFMTSLDIKTMEDTTGNYLTIGIEIPFL